MQRAFHFFDRQMSSCEIVWNIPQLSRPDLLTKIHFPVHSAMLNHITKDHRDSVIKAAMEGATPQERIDKACQAFLVTFDKVDHEVKMKQDHSFFYNLKSNEKTLTLLTIFLTVALCMLLLVGDSTRFAGNGIFGGGSKDASFESSDINSNSARQPSVSYEIYHWMIGFAAVKVLVTGFLMVIYLSMELPVLLRQELERFRHRALQRKMERQVLMQQHEQMRLVDVPDNVQQYDDES